MAVRTIGVALNGVTGRMGYRQHLVRSILALRERGGIRIGDDVLVPEPLLVGRNPAKLKEIAERHDLPRWTTDLDAALGDPDVSVYFDAQVTSAHVSALTAAIDAGKHVYSEKPVAATPDEVLELARHADAAGVKHGVVADKLYLPGIRKLKRLLDGGFFGRVLSVRGEFGYWVFEGDWQAAQRPSWNYRAEDGGGIVVDMFCHWSYLLEGLLGPVEAVTARAVTHVPTRWDENGEPYAATADDAAYAIFEMAGGVVAQVNSSWTTRVNRDELVEFHVDGTHGSAVAGLRNCKVQPRAITPKPVWDPDVPQSIDFRSLWQEVPDNEVFENGFMVQWEEFLKHVAVDAPFAHDFHSGVRTVRLAALGLESSATGRRIEVPA
ncbi:oxidoreductase [Saccharothrix sp. NRRL B-16348]|jgi:predicted dehydrogenase|uniref:Gfo/Idh/MocA family protein n=1 Tax=Saccharothrix sp. NRRL B-16348 TaxID=1415542 RepID=UPI0006AFE6C5|nr:Gfo/Idh/MocA family oxidoreductase [Saccharothrix sp. NRRL B-16348]KOX18806.1 oxidoreductase [Saccharothrix sp. NRRL B-16348]